MTEENKTKYILEKDSLIQDPTNVMAIFHLPEEDLDIIELSGIEYKKCKLKFLKDVFGETIEIFKEDKRCMIISYYFWDNIKQIFNILYGLEYADFYIADEESPLIIKSGCLGGIIAPRVEGD